MLAEAARDVPFYLFGHSHRPLDIPFVPGRQSPRYLPGHVVVARAPDLDPVAGLATAR
ncbi:MAG: hypothetical protein M3377_05925 [Actinomycetota bacterium]|nr:hypothetical protein [Actinomycetota bacterium]